MVVVSIESAAMRNVSNVITPHPIPSHLISMRSKTVDRKEGRKEGREVAGALVGESCSDIEAM